MTARTPCDALSPLSGLHLRIDLSAQSFVPERSALFRNQLSAEV